MVGNHQLLRGVAPLKAVPGKREQSVRLTQEYGTCGVDGARGGADHALRGGDDPLGEAGVGLEGFQRELVDGHLGEPAIAAAGEAEQNLAVFPIGEAEAGSGGLGGGLGSGGGGRLSPDEAERSPCDSDDGEGQSRGNGDSLAPVHGRGSLVGTVGT